MLKARRFSQDILVSVEWPNCSVSQKEEANFYEYRNHIFTFATF